MIVLANQVQEAHTGCMKARYPGTCARCGKPYRIGQSIVRPYGPAPWHTHCAAEYAKTRGYTLQERLDRHRARVA